MEYKTDKRTKNLTLRDIHVGDWVQVWSEIAKEMLSVIYSDDNPQKGEDYLTLQQAANEAVRYADALMKELKK